MLIDIHELAERLSVSESGLYQWVSQRKIPFVKLGKRLRFDTEKIEMIFHVFFHRQGVRWVGVLFKVNI